MSKETVIRTGSIAMMIAGMLWIIAFIGLMSEVGVKGNLDSFYWLLLLPTLIALGVGLLGLNAYAIRGDSSDMRVMSILAVTADALAIIGHIGVTPRGSMGGSFGLLGLVSFTALFVLLLVMGVLLQIKPLLPRWGGLPLLLTLPAAVFSLGFVFATEAMQRLLWLVPGVFMTAGVGLLLFGCAMLPTKSHTPMP